MNDRVQCMPGGRDFVEVLGGSGLDTSVMTRFIAMCGLRIEHGNQPVCISVFSWRHLWNNSSPLFLPLGLRIYALFAYSLWFARDISIIYLLRNNNCSCRQNDVGLSVCLSIFVSFWWLPCLANKRVYITTEPVSRTARLLTRNTNSCP